MQVLTCICCGNYRLERIVLDDGRGAGKREWFRLRQYRPLVGDWFPLNSYPTIDEAREALEKRGVHMLPEGEDGCE